MKSTNNKYERHRLSGLLCCEARAIPRQFLEEVVKKAFNEPIDADVDEVRHLFEMVNLVILKLFCHRGGVEALPGVDHLQLDNHYLRLLQMALVAVERTDEQ